MTVMVVTVDGVQVAAVNGTLTVSDALAQASGLALIRQPTSQS